ncbi:MAG: hydroxyacylglutathione hydrolase [Halieaceae bacterium]|jgi:hydroxyacylglutathione hydrolase|nr:hydroxyacylglutathione hydrolase [Halieaceae bacterium]
MGEMAEMAGTADFEAIADFEVAGHAAVTPIPAFSDNYIWLLDHGDGAATVVDPGDAVPVEDYLDRHGLHLHSILITHHHFDHTGGIAALKKRFGCRVYGPANPSIEGIDETLADGDQLRIGGHYFDVLAVPGHTLDHIAYFSASTAPPLLFCGDTLFAAGCGRLFEGTAAQMHRSLARLAALPADTAVYCTHEYTLANLSFARAADPENAVLAAREEQARATRAAERPTLPSTIAIERATNPFLRGDDEQLQHRLRELGRIPAEQVEAESAFAALRGWKDEF